MDPPDHPVGWRVDRSDQGVRLSGSLLTPDASRIVATIRQLMGDAQMVEIDLHGVEQIDTGVVALLGAEFRTCGVDLRLRGGDRFRPLFGLCTEGVPSKARVHFPQRMLWQIGRWAAQGIDGLEQLLGFLGELANAVGRVIRHPRVGHWKDLPLLAERAGIDGVPILMVINFLVGFVLAYMAARSLEIFGAKIYVADLVAIGMTRQLGPLMTGIVVCGRSGAAFATELGSMKVTEEIDALRTLGLHPFNWLVLPRIIALVLVVPVLTLLADIVGIGGGLWVANASLGLSTQSYLREMRSSIRLSDVASGVVMSVFFALAIGLIACMQGLAASAGPLGVGRRTTSTVVLSLFAMVAIDALLTVVFRAIGLS
jgi:phospholipid/cholesterol/gamma-HCH transport system permease protein